MNISSDGIKFIRQHEGCRLTAYQDVAGIWTIGVGHTGPEVGDGLTVTDAEADNLLRQDVQAAEDCIEQHVIVPITQGQYDALCSFIFNVGCRAFEKSTLLRRINANDVGAGAEFLKWTMAGGHPVAGLIARRKDEKELFES